MSNFKIKSKEFQTLIMLLVQAELAKSDGQQIPYVHFEQKDNGDIAFNIPLQEKK